MYLESARMQLVRAFGGAEVIALDSLGLLVDDLGRQPADLVMVDFSMPAEDGVGRSGVDGVRRVIAAASAAPVLVMSGVAIGKDVLACLAMGAKGFLPKTLDGRLLTSILSVVMGRGSSAPNSGSGSKPQPLTVLENTVLSLFLSKTAIADIAGHVARKEATVALYLIRALRKMGATDRSQFADLAQRQSLA